MNKVVMFDIDGVLADFTSGYRGIEEKRGLPITTGDSWDDYWAKEVWNEIKASPTFWMELTPVPELMANPALWREMNRLNQDIWYVTSRPGIDVRRQTEYWLRSFGIRYPQVILSNHKGEIAKGLNATHSIEDKAGNAVIIKYLQPKCDSFLIHTPYNANMDHAVIGRQVKRIYSVEEYVKVIGG